VHTGPKERIRTRARELGLDDLGFTTAEPLPHEEFLARWLGDGRAGGMSYLQRGARARPQGLLPEARTLLVAAARYARSPEEPRPIAAYAQRRDYHHTLRDALQELAGFLEQEVPRSSTRVVVDTAPLLEREAAQRAGLGWIGKSTLLVHPSFGCFTLLGEILWTHAVEPDLPGTDRCGTCRQCLDACPTGALDAAYQMDARRCLSYMTIEQRGDVPEEYRTALGTRAFGCDACLVACPFGTRNVFEDGALLPTADELRDASLAELLEQASQRFRAAFGWTPVERARKRGLLRSLLLAAGNSADVGLAAQVRRFLDDDDLAIREHARWALARLDAATGTAQDDFSSIPRAP